MAKDIVGDCFCLCCDVPGGYFLVALPAYEYDFVVGIATRYVCDVEHGHVHADCSEISDFVSSDDGVAGICERSWQSASVTDWHDCDFGISL